MRRLDVTRSVFERLYRNAATTDSLPWHRAGPPPLLDLIAARRAEGRALDVGCGDGADSVHLAQLGYSVVATDFVPAAADATRRRAERAGVEVEVEVCDAVEFRSTSPFDIVLDSGCLHHLPRRRLATYRRRVDEWLAADGDYLLVHFANRPRVGWIPGGPRHMSRRQAVEFFRPLHLRAYDELTYEVPFPMGTMRAGVYWFSRSSD